MNRIDKKFKQLRKKKAKAFITFITCGDPNITTSEKLALEFDKLGVDILELGMPFSDPLADGPAIQAASQRALKNRITLKDVFKLVQRIRRKSEMPIVILTYYNIVFHLGIDSFVKQAVLSAVDGVVIPDLPVEEAGEFIKAAKKKGLAVIFLVAPTSDTARIKKIAAKSSGFINYVSLTGTTGVRSDLPKELTAQVRKVKKLTSKPVCVGFGVSNAVQAAKVASVADGVIVGSAIVKVIAKNLGKPDLVRKTANFVNSLRKAI